MENSKALEDIAAERQRQKDGEGWTETHDDRYAQGELEHAAACYAVFGDGEKIRDDTAAQQLLAKFWPWHRRWWKPTNARRNLVKAGALIVAAIERLDRLK